MGRLACDTQYRFARSGRARAFHLCTHGHTFTRCWGWLDTDTAHSVLHLCFSIVLVERASKVAISRQSPPAYSRGASPAQTKNDNVCWFVAWSLKLVYFIFSALIKQMTLRYAGVVLYRSATVYLKTKNSVNKRSRCVGESHGCRRGWPTTSKA